MRSVADALVLAFKYEGSVSCAANLMAGIGVRWLLD
jgi:hypothetical protein